MEELEELENQSKKSHSKPYTEILKILDNLDDKIKIRILKSLIEFYDIKELKSNSSIQDIRHVNPKRIDIQQNDNLFFTKEREYSSKEFILKKDPKTDVERVACLAYYLTHYKSQPHFKTTDITNINTEAAQRKFSNAAKAVDNATTLGYLVPATKGQKQISAPGELFVQKLPDREAAKEIMKKQRRKYRKNKNTNSNENED